LPFWQTTVVEEPGGTTTVVFCGGGGLELLMQPASNPVASIALNRDFIVDLLRSMGELIGCDEFSAGAVCLGRGAPRMAMSSRVLRCRP
jgi:hypothetical protein